MTSTGMKSKGVHAKFWDKKRAVNDRILPPPAPVDNEPPHPTKRPRRAETRRCPICEECIPLRLLAKHAELESERVDEILSSIGSSEVHYDGLDCDPSPSSRTRRSANKARKTIVTRGTKDTLEQTDKTIQSVKRRRKQRQAKLREMAKEEEGGLTDSWLQKFTGKEIVCPVCSMTVRGDQDVVDAHVDACLAHESRRQEEIRQRELQHQHAIEEAAWDDEVESLGNYVGNLRGAGFHARNRNDEDVQDEIDIEGDDQSLYGEAQFTEGDVLPINTEHEDAHEDIEVNIEDDDEDETQKARQTLHDLVAAGADTEMRLDNLTDHLELDGINPDVASAQQRGDKAAPDGKFNHLDKESSSSPLLMCRICLDPYTEPTLSTGCWHTCCRECWLRCLGSTKLCPICKRITCASDLRRIYL